MGVSFTSHLHRAHTTLAKHKPAFTTNVAVQRLDSINENFVKVFFILRQPCNKNLRNTESKALESQLKWEEDNEAI